MRFLVDECLSPRVAELLRKGGHDSVSVAEIGLAGAADEDVLARAVADRRILLSADTDFGELLAASQVAAPSVILIRRASLLAESVAGMVMANIDQVADEVERGAFVVLGPDRIRLRSLPV